MNRRLRLEGKNPFYDYSLPVAILRLKQALGRTVRHRKQQSAVLILDNRVYTKRYSRQIRGVLSKTAPIEQSSFEQILQDVRFYFKNKTVKNKN
jgi:dnaQ family exonuclease/dinG family helicase